MWPTASWKNKIIDYSKRILSIKSLNSFWHALSVKCLWDHDNIDRLWNVSVFVIGPVDGWYSNENTCLKWQERNGRYQQQQPARPKSRNITSIYCSSKSTIRKINLELTINYVVTEILDAGTDHHAKGKSKTATISKVASCDRRWLQICCNR